MTHYFETENKLSLHAFVNEDKVVIMKVHDYGNIMLNIPVEEFMKIVSTYFYEVKDDLIYFDEYIENDCNNTIHLQKVLTIEEFVNGKIQKYDMNNIIALAVREYFKIFEKDFFI